MTSLTAQSAAPVHQRLLVVEDERPMRIALQDCLESEGYRVLLAITGSEGLSKITREKPDLVLLDIMLPEIDGFALCHKARELGYRAPILMLTAKGEIEDRVSGLDCGADDYLVKPFSRDELLARVRALLRREHRVSHIVLELQLGKVQVNFGQQTATRGGRSLRLTAKELAMLRLLAEAGGEAVSRERFLDIVWGFSAFPTTRTVDNHIAQLRAKIEDHPDDPRWIKTVHGVGYRLEKNS